MLFSGLAQNSLTGALPAATIGLLQGMIWLDVSSNNLSGPLPVSSMSGSGLDNLTNALHFHLQNNRFSESIPSSLFSEGMQLIHLLLNNNSLTGSIPSTIGKLLHLEIIWLDFNAFSGSLPSTINSMVNLTTLQVNNNKLTGPLPDLSSNTNLQMLIAGNNPFGASEIPSWITNMPKLYLLSMDSANLTGNIPAEIFGFNPYISNVTLGSNQLNGTLDLTQANLSALHLVDLSANAINNLIKGNYNQDLLLDGNPYCESNPTVCARPMSNSTANTTAAECSKDCVHPVVLSCIINGAKKPILKDYVVDIKQVFTGGLNRSHYLEGTALQDTQTVVHATSSYAFTVSVCPPGSMTIWPATNATNIAYALQNQDVDYFLIGAITCTFTGRPYPQDNYVDHTLTTGKIIGIVVGAATFSIVILGLVAYALKLRKRALNAEKKNKPFAAWIAAGQEGTADIPQVKGARWFSLGEIRKCTNHFSPHNEIGEGGYGKVYRGFLPSGDPVAIKRARANSTQGAAEFKAEIELLSRVHHRNLVDLIGFCFEEGEQMLVYEYMPNGTLRECLSGRTGLRMDWNRRVDVVLGSARGITYLHSHANPPIIHRDIKSSNILLDEKLVAKGTLGYLDPDYYMTSQLTTKSDVFSFGVVLLEVVTGRLPIQGGKYIVREVTTLLAKGGMELVLQELVDRNLTEYPPKALKRLLEIALNCVRDDPAERFSMAQIVKELEVLMQVSTPAFTMGIDMDEKRCESYGQEFPCMQQSNEASVFEYSGSLPLLPM